MINVYRLSTALLFIALTQLPVHASAADRIGNGGGLWACTEPNGDLRTGQLVDLFEARQEFQLSVLNNAGQTALEVYQGEKARLAVNIPRFTAQLAPYMAQVENNMVFVDAALELIDDTLWRIRPLPQDCRGGTWDYVQFANFTGYNRVLIRRDLWNDPRIDALDKAALLIHESVYLMLRETAGDLASARARQITGLLMSNLPGADTQSRIDSLLRVQTQLPGKPVPSPAPPTASWICMIGNPISHSTYLGEGPIKLDAEFDATHKCQKEFYGDHCDVTLIECAITASVSDSVSCVVGNSIVSKVYLGKGRNVVEARAHAFMLCQKEFYGDQCRLQECSEY